MDKVNEDYWFNQWHLDTELHKKLYIKNVTQINKSEPVSIYGDSVDKNSVIITEQGSYTIEELYNLQNEKSIRKDKEVIPVNFKSLNWTKKDGIHYSKVKNIIRHKTNKKKWKIKVGGKELIITEDHSLIVFRGNEKIEIKPQDIKSGDKVLIHIEEKFEIVNIDSIEEIGEFNDEYVYDLEMYDQSHSFIANDILVHNTDSIFVSFKPAMDHCTWRDMTFNDEYLSSVDKKFIILSKKEIKTDNSNLLGQADKIEDFKELLKLDYELILVDGLFIKDRDFNKLLDDGVFTSEVRWNWANEVDFIQGVDKIRFADFFKDELEKHAAKYGVENKEDFELERISESIVNLAKKKYIQHILHEDGIPYERLKYIYPKGVELVRSSTPAFAREKIVDIVKYLFSHADTFNIKDLLKLVKNLRKEFELADIDDICMQSSVSKYDTKVLCDERLPLQFVSGAHFAVKSAAHYNYLLKKNKEYQEKYEFIRSGDKIKYYVCADKSITGMFAYIRGSYPIEFAPAVDMDLQFSKSILSPINSIIESLGMPTITQRLSIVMDIFSGF